MSASTVGKLIKQFPQWVESTKQGRSVLYTYDVLKRLKLIRKLQEQKKSPQQIETALSKNLIQLREKRIRKVNLKRNRLLRSQGQRHRLD